MNELLNIYRTEIVYKIKRICEVQKIKVLRNGCKECPAHIDKCCATDFEHDIRIRNREHFLRQMVVLNRIYDSYFKVDDNMALNIQPDDILSVLND